MSNASQILLLGTILVSTGLIIFSAEIINVKRKNKS